jgi:uncharacterized protein DUF6882
MDTAEAERLRREILGDVGALLRDELIADAWGRVLVQVVRTPEGEPAVAGIDVEEIVGDEAAVDMAFSSSAARALLPTLAKATEALCALDDVELDEVGGGTFVRLTDGFAWLPGLVRTPSLDFDRERDLLVARMREKNEAVRRRFASATVGFDVEASAAQWTTGGRPLGTARATLIGTFAHGPRTWAWAWSNPNAPETVRKASAALTDALAERNLWEIATPVFATDEPTAWALAALICDRAGADGVQRLAVEDGAIFVLLRDIRDA